MKENEQGPFCSEKVQKHMGRGQITLVLWVKERSSRTVTKTPRMHQNSPFWEPNQKIFWGGHAPPPSAPWAPRFSRLRRSPRRLRRLDRPPPTGFVYKYHPGSKRNTTSDNFRVPSPQLAIYTVPRYLFLATALICCRIRHLMPTYWTRCANKGDSYVINYKRKQKICNQTH